MLVQLIGLGEALGQTGGQLMTTMVNCPEYIKAQSVCFAR